MNGYLIVVLISQVKVIEQSVAHLKCTVNKENKKEGCNCLNYFKEIQKHSFQKMTD